MIVRKYLHPLRDKQIDTLILGCTHYPLLTGVLQLVMGDDVTLVNSAEETMKTVYRTLNDRGILADRSVGASGAPAEPPSHSFESTGDPQRFAHLASRFLGPQLTSVSQIPEILR